MCCELPALRPPNWRKITISVIVPIAPMTVPTTRTLLIAR
jgi:hypothetical protein